MLPEDYVRASFLHKCCYVLLDGYVPLVLNTADLPISFPRPDDGESVTLFVRASMVVPIEEPSAVCEVTNAKVKTRKRKRDSSLHKASLRKQLRNSGKEYVSKDGTQRPSRKMSSCSCRMHCFSKVSEGQHEKLQYLTHFETLVISINRMRLFLVILNVLSQNVGVLRTQQTRASKIRLYFM